MELNMEQKLIKVHLPKNLKFEKTHQNSIEYRALKKGYIFIDTYEY